jgi:hypothetical protein
MLRQSKLRWFLATVFLGDNLRIEPEPEMIHGDALF